jgi:hypothetical protein
MLEIKLFCRPRTKARPDVELKERRKTSKLGVQYPSLVRN